MGVELLVGGALCSKGQRRGAESAHLPQPPDVLPSFLIRSVVSSILPLEQPAVKEGAQGVAEGPG